MLRRFAGEDEEYSDVYSIAAIDANFVSWHPKCILFFTLSFNVACRDGYLEREISSNAWKLTKEPKMSFRFHCWDWEFSLTVLVVNRGRIYLGTGDVE